VRPPGEVQIRKERVPLLALGEELLVVGSDLRPCRPASRHAYETLERVVVKGGPSLGVVAGAPGGDEKRLVGGFEQEKLPRGLSHDLAKLPVL